MKITVIPGRLLTPEQIAAWSALQAADVALSSPFLCPEFTSAVAAVRDDVHVGVLEDGGTPVGFFPYHRSRLAMARPVAGWLTDVQGVIVQSRMNWNPVQLVRGCGLAAWEFTRLASPQPHFEPFQYRRRMSAVIDLSGGPDAYLAERAEALKPYALARKARKLARETGPIRFEPQSSDGSVLETLMRWKCHRYAAHGYLDALAIPWVRRLFERLLGTRAPRFAGMLSAMYAGDELVAAHFGMRSNRTWHWWYPAYNPEFARYSPGLLLLWEMIRSAPTVGVGAIDLGGADEYPYKRSFMNRSVVLLEGTVGSVPVITYARRWRHLSAQWVRQSPVLHPPARRLLRASRRVKHSLLYEWAESGTSLRPN